MTPEKKSEVILEISIVISEAATMSSLDDFALHLSTTDTKKKLTIGQEIIDYLGQPDNSADCEDLGAFIDGLVPWMQSSNFKVRF